jgi:hypothetical protein
LLSSVRKEYAMRPRPQQRKARAIRLMALDGDAL